LATPDPIISCIRLVDNADCPVFEQPDGRQYVLDDDGDCVYGVWFIPRDECNAPIIVDTLPG
jgi:hypothetical protein